MKAKTNAHRLSGAEVMQLVTNIIAAGTGKPELATSPITMAQMQTLVDNGTIALNEEGVAEDIATTKRTALRLAMKALRAGVNQFATFADSVYDGDTLQLQAVGLGVRVIAPVGLLPAPLNLRSRPGAVEGTMDLDWKRVTRGRPEYWAECGPSANGPWALVYTGRAARTTCTNLTSGTEYFFRVRCNGKAGFGPWSDITKRRAP